jgi:hypothetical protein
LRGSEDFQTEPVSNSWIYVGGNIYDPIWSKVGKTTNGLNTRHRSSQNPGYFIYTAYNILRGSVHDIELYLLEQLARKARKEQLFHFSTGNPSECFRINPRQMAFLVEELIYARYSYCLTFENSTHGGMSRYECRKDISRYLDDVASKPSLSVPKANKLGSFDYFTGNQEMNEVDLGDGYFMDTSSLIIRNVLD